MFLVSYNILGTRPDFKRSSRGNKKSSGIEARSGDLTRFHFGSIDRASPDAATRVPSSATTRERGSRAAAATHASAPPWQTAPDVVPLPAGHSATSRRDPEWEEGGWAGYGKIR